MAVEGLRRATPDDTVGITQLTHETYRDYIPLIGRKPLPMNTDYAQAIHEHEIWVLEHNAEIIAVLDMLAKPDSLYIDNVAVRGTHQSRGIGRELLAFAEARARELGLHAMTLFTNERYTRNLEIYARLGYVETHRVLVQGTNAVHLRKDLSPLLSEVRR